MFLHLCVIRFTGGGSVSGGSASRGWGLHPGGSASRGRVCIRGVPIGGVCIQGSLTVPPPIRYYGIQSMSGRYASYWNIFLFINKVVQYQYKGLSGSKTWTETEMLMRSNPFFVSFHTVNSYSNSYGEIGQ